MVNRVRWLVLLLIPPLCAAGGVSAGCAAARCPHVEPPGHRALAHDRAERPTPAELESLAAADPLAFLKLCREEYRTEVADYRCRFTIQERVKHTLGSEQVMEITFREDPYSVDMRWVKNPGQAKRITYVQDRWVFNGKQQARIELTGLIGVLFPGGVRRNIHAPDVLAASRRPIDQFGFANTLDLMIGYCEQARDDPAYDLRYHGRERFNDRWCYVIERRLPYTGPEGPFPDRVLVAYIDTERLVPMGCYSYADLDRATLIGRYVLSDVTFNVGITHEDF